jgi:hypothetical protein
MPSLGTLSNRQPVKNRWLSMSVVGGNVYTPKSFSLGCVVVDIRIVAAPR